MRLGVKLLTLLVLAVMAIDTPQAIARRSADLQVPEFVITKPAVEYCQFVIDLPPAAANVAQKRLFDFMEAASAYTNGWRRTFAIVGVNYVTHRTFSLISFASCQAPATALDFVAQFVERWQNLHCAGGCRLSKPRIASRPNLDFVIPYENYTFRSQIDEFLHYHQQGALSGCTIEVDLAPAIIADFPHTQLFGAVMDLQKKFRYPIMDISQIDRKLYILLSRQCRDKEALYASMLRNLKLQGVGVDALQSANFGPDVSDYLFSQTGHR